MIVGALLGMAGAARSALGWRTETDGHVLDARLDALFACLRLITPRNEEEPTPVAARAATLRMKKLLGSRRLDRSIAVRRLVIPGEPPLEARLYAPAAPEGAPSRLLVYFHGGGFVVGDLDTHDPLCRRVAACAGILVLSVAYRLAPEHPFPAPVDDALRAFDWAAENSESLGAAPGRIGVGGDSAGGNLAAVVSLARRGGGGPMVQWLLYPALDLVDEGNVAESYGLLLTVQALRWFGRQYIPAGQDTAHPHLSPLRALDLSGVCPAVIVTAGFDPLRDQGFAYADALRRAGAAVEHLHYAHLPHGFADFASAAPAARAALDDAARRLGASGLC